MGLEDMKGWRTGGWTGELVDRRVEYRRLMTGE